MVQLNFAGEGEQHRSCLVRRSRGRMERFGTPISLPSPPEIDFISPLFLTYDKFSNNDRKGMGPVVWISMVNRRQLWSGNFRLPLARVISIIHVSTQISNPRHGQCHMRPQNCNASTVCTAEEHGTSHPSKSAPWQPMCTRKYREKCDSWTRVLIFTWSCTYMYSSGYKFITSVTLRPVKVLAVECRLHAGL